MSLLEENYLIFVPNDYSSTFCVPEKIDGSLSQEDYYFNWMLKRGTFYRFCNYTHFEYSMSFLSSLNLGAFGFPVPDHFDFTFLKEYLFNTFTPPILATWFSKKLSSSFDNENIFSLEDFQSSVLHFGSSCNMTERTVHVFLEFEDFDKVMKDFLFRFKNINTVAFYKVDYITNEEYLW